MAVWQLNCPYSWEPEGNIHQCERLLDSFWDVIGRDDDDHPIGYQVDATREWISACSIIQYQAYLFAHTDNLTFKGKEKQYFARVFAPHDSDSDDQPQMPKKASTTNFVFNHFLTSRVFVPKVDKSNQARVQQKG